jgi:HKD family nuclease
MLLSPAERLLGVHDRMLPIHPRPDTPLSFGCLLTATSSDPSLVSQLQQEILNADGIDILCSFIKWSGIRILRDELEEFTRQKHARLWIITTSYLGATDFKAIELLQSLPNTRLWVSYDTKRTRLHAKAYIFHRNSGFGTAYVGSSNLSNPALTSGLE